MFFAFSKPSQHQADTIIDRCRALPYNYPDVGATALTPSRTALSTTYALDHNRVLLGVGQETFIRAQQALIHWRMCNLGWAEICGTAKAIDPGTVIACVPQLFGLWLINPCRVVYRIEEQVDGITRFGLAYGTLPGHAAAGEERFLVEWHHEDDTVWYDILAFSQPGHWAMRLGYPVMRQFQRAYGRDSAKAMVHACINEAELTDAREYGPLLATVP